MVEATKVVAARFVVVDVIDDSATRFYEHHGFKAIPGTKAPCASYKSSRTWPLRWTNEAPDQPSSYGECFLSSS